MRRYQCNQEIAGPLSNKNSNYRIIKSLRELELTAKTYNLKPQIVVCRELTKKFETIYRGKIEEVINQLAKSEIKGEFVKIVRGK